MADAMCHSKIFWKHFTFGSSEFHVWFTPWFPEGLESMTFFFSFTMPYMGSKMPPNFVEDFIPSLWWCWKAAEV